MLQLEFCCDGVVCAIDMSRNVTHLIHSIENVAGSVGVFSLRVALHHTCNR